MGLGIKPGIKYLSEESGYLPREKFVNKGDIASLSIGQGSVLVSPLQLANMMRTVALMGEHSSPSIINERLNGITVDDSIPRAQIVSEIPKNLFPLVANGLLQVIKNPLGSGAAARQSSFEVAGKTGTAQWKYKNTASNVVWFSGFFPFQRPKYAYAVLVEGSAGTTNMSGGANAAPLLGAFINEISNDEFIEKINTWMAQGRSMPQYRYVTPHLDERSGRSADDEAPVRRAVRAR